MNRVITIRQSVMEADEEIARRIRERMGREGRLYINIIGSPGSGKTTLLNIINHQTLIATKASRVVYAAEGDGVLEFGLRRAQGPDAGVYGARAAIIGAIPRASRTAVSAEAAPGGTLSSPGALSTTR